MSEVKTHYFGDSCPGGHLTLSEFQILESVNVRQQAEIERLKAACVSWENHAAGQDAENERLRALREYDRCEGCERLKIGRYCIVCSSSLENCIEAAHQAAREIVERGDAEAWAIDPISKALRGKEGRWRRSGVRYRRSSPRTS